MQLIKDVRVPASYYTDSQRSRMKLIFKRPCS